MDHDPHNAHDFPLIAAAHTPMHPDGKLNFAAIAEQAAHFRQTGVRGVFVGGSTGEGQSLAIDERVTLAELWVDAAKEQELRCIISVGHNCQVDAAQLALHAQEIQADGIACQAPCFFRPATIEELIQFLAPIARQAESLPFYLYDLPSLTGVSFPTSDVLETAKPQIPTLAGVKYTNQDLMELQRCVHLDNGAYEVLWGCDEAMLAGIALGARGAVGSTYNFAAPLYQRIIAAFADSDFATARALQLESCRIVKVIQQFGFTAAAKAVMSMIGVDCGPARAPLRDLNTAERRQLREDLEAIDFFSLVSSSDIAEAV